MHPDDTVDVLHGMLKAWQSQRLVVLGTRHIAKYCKALRMVVRVSKQKIRQRAQQIASVVDYWDEHEASQRALLRAPHRPKLCARARIARDLSWFLLPTDLKHDIVRKLYWAENRNFNRLWYAWFAKVNGIRAQCDKMRLKCKKLRALGGFNLADAEVEHQRLILALFLAKVVCRCCAGVTLLWKSWMPLIEAMLC